MSDPGVAVVIEDDLDVRSLVSAILTQSGFDVRAAPNGREGVELVRNSVPAVVTLDVGLPDIDGYEVLRRVRQFTDCYIIMLTARSDELDTLMALQSGADDFLTKPFRPRELRARIEALLRRPRQNSEPDKPNGDQPAAVEPPSPPRRFLSHNGLELEPSTRTATVRDDELNLTRSEFDILQELLRSGGAVRTKASLVKIVRGDYFRDDAYVSEADERAIEVHVGNLRRKLQEDPREPRWVLTVRGVGYRLAPKRAE